LWKVDDEGKSVLNRFTISCKISCSAVRSACNQCETALRGVTEPEFSDHEKNPTRAIRASFCRAPRPDRAMAPGVGRCFAHDSGQAGGLPSHLRSSRYFHTVSPQRFSMDSDAPPVTTGPGNGATIGRNIARFFELAGVGMRWSTSTRSASPE
jgi:hypothetical protein